MTSLVDILKPADKSRALVFNVVCILGGSLFLALLSQFSLRLWFTPVPITLQTLGVMLLAALLGGKRSALAVLAYLGEGALGLPFFANGLSGIPVLLGPTGGYLFSFVVSAYVMGFFMEKVWQQNFFSTVAALTIGSVITLGMGAFWLSFYVGKAHALQMGVYPFLIGCGLKILVAAAIIKSGDKLGEKYPRL